MTTLVVDTGQSIVGIYSVDDGVYVPYQYDKIPDALDRIADADEVITYNGKRYDLRKLGEFAGLSGDFPCRGLHVDMRSICWSDRILGGSLRWTYFAHFGTPPDFPDTHEGNNELDCYMTFKIWQRWQLDDLWIFDGYFETSKIYEDVPSESDKSFMLSYSTHLPGEGRRTYDRSRDGTWRLRSG